MSNKEASQTSVLTFPKELEGQKRPSITFTQENTGTQIRFPVPAGMTFSETASYGEEDLGAHGAAIANAFADGDRPDPDSLPDKPTKSTGIAGLLAAATPKSTGIGIGMGVSVNKHTTTEFGGVGTRSHSYNFKLVASSSEESTTISQIVKTFTEGLYPTKDVASLTLKYPEQWKIDFEHVNAYIPPIFDCYLSSFSSTYNGAAHAWYEGGSPVEVDITLGFTETKARTRDDFTAANN